MNKGLYAQSVTKRYLGGGDEVRAVDAVDLTVSLGEFVAIVGPSGSGKSTLLHILGGLEKPTRGQVFFDGDDIYRKGDHALSAWRNETVGFVFQFYHLLGELTVAENVALPALLKGRSRKSALKKSRELLQYLGISEKKNSFPSQLSGGQKQKVAFARALINDPDILFCDEPTGNLDGESAEKVMAFLSDWHRKKQKTVIMVTHNRELAREAGRLLHLRDGRLGQA